MIANDYLPPFVSTWLTPHLAALRTISLRDLQPSAAWKTFFPLVVLLLLPFVLLLSNTNWIYLRPDTVDPWVYIGYYLHPRNHLTLFGHAYYGTRLPTILLGSLAFSLFTPIVALHVLHLLLYYVAVFSAYFILKLTVSARAALLTAILLGCHATFLAAIGTNHSDSFGIAYFLLTMLLLTLTARSASPQLLLVLSGMSFASLVFTNIAYFLFTPLFAFHYAFLNRRAHQTPWPVTLRWGMGGAVGLTVLLCIANWILCGRWLFFAASFRFAFAHFGTPNVCADSTSLWMLHVSWLVIPTLVGLSSFYVWWKGLANGTAFGSLFTCYFCNFLMMFGIMMAFEWLHIIRFLQFSFYASLLIPPMFLTLGALIALLTERLDTRQYVGVLAAAFVCSAWVFLAPIGDRSGLGPRLLLIPFAMGLVSFFCVVQPTLLARCTPYVAVVLFSVTNMVVGIDYERFLSACPLERAHTPGEKLVGTWVDVPKRSRPPTNVDKAKADQRVVLDLMGLSRGDAPEKLDWGMYASDFPSRSQVLLAAVEAVEVIRHYDVHRDIRFWYNVDEPLGSVFSAIASTYLWDVRMLGLRFPSLSDHPWGKLPDMRHTKRIVILSRPEVDVFPFAVQSLALLNLTPRLVNEHRLVKTRVPIKMTFLDIN